MKRLINIIIILMVVTLSHPGFAQDEIQGVAPTQGVDLTEDQTHALDFVNKIRKDPLAYAVESLGYEREKLMHELPWLAEIIEEGLPPCRPNEGLNALAEQKNSEQDKIEETDAENTEKPVKTPLESDFVLNGEMGGVVSFYSFMPAEFAWEIVIVNQFLQELRPDMQGPLYILNPRFDTMGMAMRGGPNEVDGVAKNAYFATICFVSSRLKAEAQVLNMVNQVRYNPYSIDNYMDSSLIEILGYNLVSLSRWRWLYPDSSLWDSSNLPPLFEDSTLHDSARHRVLGLLNPDDPLLQEVGQTPPDTELYEVKEESVAQVMIPVATSAGSASDEPALRVFKSMLSAELKEVYRQGAIFSIKTDKGGVAIALEPGGSQRHRAGAVLHAARIAPYDDAFPVDSNASNRVGIYGVVYFDMDGNEIYSPGEGKERVSVDVYRMLDGTLVGRTFTDGSGHFSVSLERDLEYRLEINSGEIKVSISKMLSKSLFLPVDLSSHYP